MILYYKNDILLNVSLHIFRNSAICGIYIQYVCKCQILVDFHPDLRTLRSLFPFWLFRIIDLFSSKGLLHHRNFHLPYHWHIDEKLKLYCPWDLPPAAFIFNLIEHLTDISIYVLLDKYPLEISLFSLLDGFIISPGFLFVNTFLLYFLNKFIIIYNYMNFLIIIAFSCALPARRPLYLCTLSNIAWLFWHNLVFLHCLLLKKSLDSLRVFFKESALS